MNCRCGLHPSQSVHSHDDRWDGELEKGAHHLLDALLFSRFKKWPAEELANPKMVCCCCEKRAQHNDSVESQKLSPHKDIDFQALEKWMKSFLRTMMNEQQEARRKKHCPHGCKCQTNNDDFVESKKACKCRHSANDQFFDAEERESEFPKPPKKPFKRNIPDHLWLPDVLSLLHKQGMLKLNALFPPEHSRNMLESSSLMLNDSSSHPCKKADMNILHDLFGYLQNDDESLHHHKAKFHYKHSKHPYRKKGSPF